MQDVSLLLEHHTGELARMGEAIDVASEHTVRLDADADAIAAHETTAPDTGVAAHHLGYIIYTSGSTGRPKGVLVPHRGVVNSCKTLADWLELGPGQRMLQFASLSFDVSVHEYVPALMSGMTLCLATKDDLIPGPSLVDLIRDLEINVATLPPSVLAVLPYGELPALRIMQVAGEAFTSESRSGPGRRSGTSKARCRRRASRTDPRVHDGPHRQIHRCLRSSLLARQRPVRSGPR